VSLVQRERAGARRDGLDDFFGAALRAGEADTAADLVFGVVALISLSAPGARLRAGAA